MNADEKDKLRDRARASFRQLHPELAEAMKLGKGGVHEIHHRCPLEYAHLLVGEDINDRKNLVAVAQPVHRRINNLWAKFRKGRDGSEVHSDEVKKMAEIIDRHFQRWYDVLYDSRSSSALDTATEKALRDVELLLARGEAMPSASLLPGFERMLQVCQKHGIEVHQQPPVSIAPRAGEPVAGLPCDPLLSAVHSRVGTLGLLDGFFLLPLETEEGTGLVTVNEEWRRDWSEPFRGLLVFAKEQALAYYYATVPKLADDQGIQPVVRVDTHEDLYALPIASSIDRFFDTYSHSLERQVALIHEDAEFKARIEAEFGPPTPDSLRALWSKDIPRISFPWEVPDLIARDEPLVKLLQAGRFDFLMEGCEDVQKWVGKVLAAAST